MLTEASQAVMLFRCKDLIRHFGTFSITQSGMVSEDNEYSYFWITNKLLLNINIGVCVNTYRGLYERF